MREWGCGGTLSLLLPLIVFDTIRAGRWGGECMFSCACVQVPLVLVSPSSAMSLGVGTHGGFCYGSVE